MSGKYCDNLPLANITIAGAAAKPANVNMWSGGKGCETRKVQSCYKNGVLSLTNMHEATGKGAWNSELVMTMGEHDARSHWK